MRHAKTKKPNDVTLYPITLEPHEEGGYFAACPLFQGCHAEGETIGEAIDNIRDVILGHFEARKKFRETTPSVTVPSFSQLRFTIPLPISR